MGRAGNEEGRNHVIRVVGIGPGNPAYIVPAAAAAIRDAGVLVGGRRALAQFARDDGRKQMAITRDIDGVLAFIRESLDSEDVVVMVSGDPGYYSMLDALRRTFPTERIRVIPGISAMQLAFSRIALPWHGAHLLSFHGRVPERAAYAYETGRVLGMLTDAKHTSRTIPALLMEAGWKRDARLYVCARLSYEDERIVRTTLGEAAELDEVASGILIVTDEEVR